MPSTVRAHANTNMLIDKLNSIVGLQIIETKYILTKFHHPNLQEDWTKIYPDSFVLHGQEWQIKFSNGLNCYMTNHQGDLTSVPLKSNNQ